MAAVYGSFLYGGALYGFLPGFPVSPEFNVFDFCYPTESTMGSLFAFPEASAPRFTSPYMWYNASFDLCMRSDDGADSGFRIDLPVPQPTFTMQFAFQSNALPPDFSDLANSRFFVATFNQFGKMAGLLISEDGGIALAQSGTGPYIVLPDSADIFDESPDDYQVIRFTVNETTNRGNLYVTPKDVLAATGEHILRYTFTLYDTPAGEVDNFRVELRGTAVDPVQVCMDCIRLDDREKIPNRRPVAVPGPDQTQVVGQYASFDGRGSYDPEGEPLTYWWTATDIPDGSAYRIPVSGTAPADPTGFTNVIQGVAGDFDEVVEGDVFVDPDGFSSIMYVAADGSYIVLVDDILVAGSSVEGYVGQQVVWGGARLGGVVEDVLGRQNTPAVGPIGGDTYLVGEAPVGLWTGMAGYLATWDAIGASWVFSLPALDYIVYVMGEFECYRHAGTGLWYEDAPKGWELDFWEGRVAPIGVLITDALRLHTVELIVNDGELDSLPAEVLLNVYETNVQLGLTPDLTFVWNYISDFWNIVQGIDQVEAIWSGLTQVYSDLLMRLWQYDYSKSILDIQRLFQVRWINYNPLYLEPDYEEVPADIEFSLNDEQYSVVPSAVVTLADGTVAESDRTYDLGWVIPDVSDVNYLTLNGVPYKIARVDQGATTRVITETALPTDGVIGIDTTPPITPSDGDQYMVDNLAVGAWAGHDGEIATWDEAGSSWVFTESIRPKAWMIRPSVKSQQSNFSDLRVSPGDTAIFEARLETGDFEEIECYVYGAGRNILIFDDRPVSGYLASENYTTRFKSVRRRSQMYVDDLVLSMPRLQEIIALDRVTDPEPPLLENRDYRIESVTTIEDKDVNTIQFYNFWYPFDLRGFAGYSGAVSRNYFFDASVDFEATFGEDADMREYVLEIEGEGTFRLFQVISATQIELYDNVLKLNLTGKKWWVRRRVSPPDSLWAEITHLDNRPLIEANFGHLVGFDLDHLEGRTDDLDYLSAVQGLWYFKWHGRTPYNIRVGSQIILGLPFAEKAGTIIDIQDPYDSSRSRVLVQDEDNDLIVRSYFYPTTLGLEINSVTGNPYTVGDAVPRFAPLSQGIDVVDWESDPDWWTPYAGSADFYEPQKIHSFGMLVDADAFNLTNLLFLIDYIKGSQENRVVQNKPTYTWPFFSVIKSIGDTVDVADPFLIGPIPAPSPYVIPAGWTAIAAAPSWDDCPFERTKAVGDVIGADRKGYVPPTYATQDESFRAHRLAKYEVTFTPASLPALGAWAGHEGEIAVWDADSGGWDFYEPTPPEPLRVEAGGLHMADAPGRVPDGWSGAWGDGSPGVHEPTIAEGTFKADEINGSGRPIHRADASLSAVNVLTDGNMNDGVNPGPGRPWRLVGSPTATKVTAPAPVYEGTHSCYIISALPDEGIYQDFPSVVDTGFQIGARGWLYVVADVALVRLIDQDGATIIAEKKFNVPSNQWIQFTVHAWAVSDGGGSPVPPRLQILTGPAGAEFYVDDVGLYEKLMPWEQFGGDRSRMGRTGGYTFGGSPDEFWQFRMYGPLP